MGICRVVKKSCNDKVRSIEYGGKRNSEQDPFPKNNLDERGPSYNRNPEIRRVSLETSRSLPCYGWSSTQAFGTRAFYENVDTSLVNMGNCKDGALHGVSRPGTIWKRRKWWREMMKMMLMLPMMFLMLLMDPVSSMDIPKRLI